MNNTIEPTPVKDRDNLDLLELVCQLHARSLSYPSKEMHDAAVEARKELELRLTAYASTLSEVSDAEIEAEVAELYPIYDGLGELNIMIREAENRAFYSGAAYHRSRSQQSGWVEIKQGDDGTLPNEGQIVLVADKSGNVRTCQYRFKFFYRYVETLIDDRLISYYWNDIVQWCPLPSPPKTSTP
jgi:hypothetical protein